MSELVVQRCAACEHRMFPRRLACSRCGGTVLLDSPAGAGRVLDCVQILRSPGVDPAAPLVLLRVELEGGPRLVARASEVIERDSVVTITDDGGALAAVSSRSRR